MSNGSEIRYLGSLPGACDETTIAGARQLRTVETSGTTPESIKRWVHLSLPGLLGRLSLFLPYPPPQHRISDAGRPLGVRDSSTQALDTYKKSTLLIGGPVGWPSAATRRGTKKGPFKGREGKFRRGLP